MDQAVICELILADSTATDGVIHISSQIITHKLQVYIKIENFSCIAPSSAKPAN